MTYAAYFRPLPPSDKNPAEHLRRRTPAVFRGMATHWPAVSTWTLAYLASLDPSPLVRLVRGNRENTPTAFTWSELGTYLQHLSEPPRADDDLLYLKEFDLLRQFPALRDDLKDIPFLPRGTVTSSSVWIGPARARTGLHQDLLDNCAVQIAGRKRFLLARPGTVERAGALSTKYDAWARLSRVGIEELAVGRGAGTGDEDFYFVELEPGDVLYVPARWWHEVVNLDASILLSGFFGSRSHVARLWTQVRLRDTLHRSRLLKEGDCTCHPARR
ncbi:cupin-like domain-containing protein [Streptomyces canus]|uniref:cupin-like domain-containing protein n=1 Tax=Streptomyces canus TaxID=58343 RepID=UPI00339DC399